MINNLSNQEYLNKIFNELPSSCLRLSHFAGLLSFHTNSRLSNLPTDKLSVLSLLTEHELMNPNHAFLKVQI